LAKNGTFWVTSQCKKIKSWQVLGSNDLKKRVKLDVEFLTKPRHLTVSLNILTSAKTPGVRFNNDLQEKGLIVFNQPSLRF